MITMEQMREKYPPQVMNTQQDFDTAMNQLRRAHTEAIDEKRTKLEALNERRREIGRQLAELNIELGNVNREREVLRDEMGHIGGIFYGLKKELIRLNPKTVPPTAREEASA